MQMPAKSRDQHHTGQSSPAPGAAADLSTQSSRLESILEGLRCEANPSWQAEGGKRAWGRESAWHRGSPGLRQGGAPGGWGPQAGHPVRCPCRALPRPHAAASLLLFRFQLNGVTPEIFSKSLIQNSLPVTDIILFQSSQHFHFLVFCYLLLSISPN